VEAAIVLPVIAMMVFGMVTFGIALSHGNAIENAARETSRYGATRPVTTTDAWLDDVAAVAVAAATGDLDASAPDRYLCVALVNTKTHDGRRITEGASTTYGTGSCPTTDGTEQACPSTAPCVQVVLERSAVLDTVAFRRTITVRGSSVTAFEREAR
jgi:Flp pilus assembly protein TadG